MPGSEQLQFISISYYKRKILECPLTFLARLFNFYQRCAIIEQEFWKRGF